MTRPLTLKRRLLVLIAVALLPVVILAIVGMLVLARQDYDSERRASIERVRAISSAVDAELSRSIAALATLSTSQLLARGQLAEFYEDCLRVRAQQPAWVTLSLARPDGTYIFNLRQPFGTALPRQETDLAAIQRVVETGKPVVGSVFQSQLTRESIFSIRVPVVIEGITRYVLSVAVKPTSILEVIQRQAPPDDSVITVLDANQVVVARSRSHEQFSGKPASRRLREIMAAGREAWGTGRTLEGQQTYSAVSKSEWSGWAVAFGRPRDAIEGPVRRSLITLGAGILLSLAAGLLAAAYLGRNITRPIQELHEAARAIGDGNEPRFSKSGIVELNEVSDALVNTAHSLAITRAEHERLVSRTQEARRIAEDANQAKDEFLAMLGHELRNPLAAISNSVHILEKRSSREDVARTAQQVISRQTAHLVRLMDDLLDVGRVTSGKIVLERAHLNLAEVVEHVVGTLRTAGQLHSRGLSVKLMPVWVYADASRIEQVISNLVVNALKYSGAETAVEVTLERVDGLAILRVRDQGIGIEADLLPKVFDLFVQGARTLDRAQGGLGIGLTLVRRLVELHGGSVTAESAGAGLGSAFAVRLPAVEAPAVVDRTPTAGKHIAQSVLIVEDNEDARATLKMLLADIHGHVVYEAADGPAGVRMALEKRPDVAFIDLGLPGFDGHEVARRIRQAIGPNSMRLIALTGYGGAEDHRRTAESGFDLHLVKPVDPETLQRVFSTV